VNLAYGQNIPRTEIIQCVDPQADVCQLSPAAKMGLRPTDKIISVNGTEYQTWESVLAAVQANMENLLQLDVLRDGERVSLPEVSGMVVTRADTEHPDQTIEVGFLGVGTAYDRVKFGPVGTLKQMWEMTTQSVAAIAKLPVTAVQVLINMITGQERDPNGPISIVGAASIAGEVAAADAALSTRIAIYVSLLASINLFVALLNLVPLPPFDGGHVAAGFFEVIRRQIAKIRRKPDPGPVDTAKLLPVTYTMTVLLVLMGVILIVADIVSPVSLF